jgi:hypothetical protein
MEAMHSSFDGPAARPEAGKSSGRQKNRKEGNFMDALRD